MKCEKCGHENTPKATKMDLHCPCCGKELLLKKQSPGGYFGQPDTVILEQKKPK
jgi:DNA-directed RNA polymerase subunit RPC12/RpoP